MMVCIVCLAAFKTRAAKLEGILKNVGISVAINPEKPRKGCFEVRTGTGEKVMSALIPKYAIGR